MEGYRCIPETEEELRWAENLRDMIADPGNGGEPPSWRYLMGRGRGHHPACPGSDPRPSHKSSPGPHHPHPRASSIAAEARFGLSSSCGCVGACVEVVHDVKVDVDHAIGRAGGPARGSQKTRPVSAVGVLGVSAAAGCVRVVLRGCVVCGDGRVWGSRLGGVGALGDEGGAPRMRVVAADGIRSPSQHGAGRARPGGWGGGFGRGPARLGAGSRRSPSFSRSRAFGLLYGRAATAGLGGGGAVPGLSLFLSRIPASARSSTVGLL